jgi:hypothetical protein
MKKLMYGVLVLLAAGGACLAQSEQPSLGDLARQSKAEKKPARVFTNENVATTHSSVMANDAPRPAAALASSSSSAAPAGESKPEKKKESAGKDAAAAKDKPEVAELKQKLSSYKEEQEGWKRSAKHYQDLLTTETSEFRRQMYQDALQGDQNNVQLFQTKIDQAEADLAKAEKSQSGH